VKDFRTTRLPKILGIVRVVGEAQIKEQLKMKALVVHMASQMRIIFLVPDETHKPRRPLFRKKKKD
jgi:hypothetical protein